MTEEVIEQEVEVTDSFLDMSDDEFEQLDHSVQPEPVQEEEPEEEVTEEAVEEQEEEQEQESVDEQRTEPVPSTEESTEEKEEAKPAEQSQEIDYKAAYERLTAPFKANGKEMRIENIDDAITLMQMGANYNKKMAALKPNLKLLKLLENNNLLSEEKLGFLIDLEKKDPSAITKLIKDSGIDPLDVDTEKAGDYKPTTYTVDEREMELDAVLEEIQDTPAYTKTIDIVGTKWDGPSKQVIASNPQVLKVINDHVDRGIYDLISNEMERQRVLGRLNGLSDIEAYRQVGDAIQAQGGFDHLVQPNQRQQVTPQKEVVTPKPKTESLELKSKKRAASSTKPAVSVTTSPADYNPLAMSDEEFSKLVNERLL